MDRVMTELCVICGERSTSSGQGDHVPPKSIYTKTEKRENKFQLHTVPACSECNNGGAKSDEFWKVFVQMLSYKTRSPSQIADSIKRTFSVNSKMKNTVLDRSTDWGNENKKVTFNPSDLEDSFFRMGRAMYWVLTGDFLDKNCGLEWIDTSFFNEVGGFVFLDLAKKTSYEIVNSNRNRVEVKVYKEGLREATVNGGTFTAFLADMNEFKVMGLSFFQTEFFILRLMKDEGEK